MNINYKIIIFIAENNITSSKHLFGNNQGVAAKSGKTKGQLPLEHFLDFVNSLEKQLIN